MADLPPNITTVIVAVLSSTLLTQLLPKVYDSIKAKLTGKQKASIETLSTQMKQLNDDIATLQTSQKYLLQDRLLHLCIQYLNDGEIRHNELQSLIHLYETYHKLGGNEFITDLYERVKDMPIVKD